MKVQIGRYDGASVDRNGQPHFSWTGDNQAPTLAAAFQVCLCVQWVLHSVFFFSFFVP
jgi:hypothetical protein